MLQTTDDKALSTQATENKRNQDISAVISDAGTGDAGARISRSIKNLSTAAKLVKSKKPKMTNFETNFFTLKAKKAFTHLQKAFTKASILYYFDPKHYICIETNVLGYAIGEVLIR